MLPQQTQNADSVKMQLRDEMLRYEHAIDSDSPFSEARRIRKKINRLKNLLAKNHSSFEMQGTIPESAVNTVPGKLTT